MKISLIPAILLASSILLLPGCDAIKSKYYELTGQQPEGQTAEGQVEAGEGEHGEAGGEKEEGKEGEGEEGGEEDRKIVVTSPIREDVDTAQRYVCQIHSRRHIEVCALEGGYLEEIKVKEGQAVKQGDVLFDIYSVLYEARLAADVAEADVKRIKYKNTLKLYQQKNVSDQLVALAKAELDKAEAKVALTKAELGFTKIKAPFDGIIGQQMQQQGSLISEGDILTTMSDNDVMWVYFNVPEARYLEYKQALAKGEDESGLKIELMLANHNIFPQLGKIAAIEADFNNMTGNIRFRADFPNPDGLLRYGQTGTILIHHLLEDVLVIPQRAVYEILAKRFVYVIGDGNVVRQREITIQTEQEDIFVIKSGLDLKDKIIFEGKRQVRDGDKVNYTFRDPNDILSHLKNHAE